MCEADHLPVALFGAVQVTIDPRNPLIVYADLWANRLAGDARLPQDKRITRITQKVRLGEPLEAGLFGPVQLRIASSSGAPSAPATGKPGGVNADQ